MSLRHILLLFLLVLPATTSAQRRVPDASDLDHGPVRIRYAPAILPEGAGSACDVTLLLRVSAEGRVQRIESVHAPDRESGHIATRAVRQWEFAPARLRGKPTPFLLHATVPLRPGQPFDGDADTEFMAIRSLVVTGAIPEFQTIPEYPESLRSSPIEGSAVVNVFVDADGRPDDPVVEFASHPAFAPIAASTVLEWTFAPATRNRQPFGVRTVLEVHFSVEAASWSAEERLKRTLLSYALDYDIGPQERTTVPVVFPFQALMDGAQAKTHFKLVVSPEGRVAHIAAEEGTDPEFAMAGRASLAGWRFSPAMKSGRAVYGVVVVEIVFEPNAEAFGHDDTTGALLEATRSDPSSILTVRQVDTPPRPARQSDPILPPGSSSVLTGEALIECIIDTSGRPQLPRIIRATSPDLGWAAATAVAQWRFHPATKDGRPVACRARLPLRFAAPESPATP